MSKIYKTYIGLKAANINKIHLFYRLRIIKEKLKTAKGEEYLEACFADFDCRLALVVFKFMEGQKK
jgi:hypothetical protein